MSTTASRGPPRPRRGQLLGRLASGVLLVLIIVIVVGQLIGHPLLVAFVETGSMQPTLDPGDGFLTIPPSLAGDIDAGAVITYRAEELGGGGLTTHRVVEVTDEGFITAGDANPFTDQAAGEPPVPRDRIVAVAVQFQGQVVVIPGLGAVIGAVGDALTTVQTTLAAVFGTRSFLGVQGLAFLLLAASIVGYVADVILATPQKRRTRETGRSTGIPVPQLLVVVAVLVGAAATVAMVAPSGTAVYAFDSVEPSPSIEGGIPVGEQRTIEATVANAGLVPTFVLFETDDPGVTVPESPVLVWPRQKTTVPVTLTAPSEPGRYQRTVDQHRYLAVLPPGFLSYLHHVHPWVAMGAVDVTLVAVFLGVGRLVVGRGRVRVRPARDRGKRVPLRRWLWGRDQPED